MINTVSVHYLTGARMSLIIKHEGWTAGCSSRFPVYSDSCLVPREGVTVTLSCCKDQCLVPVSSLGLTH